MARNDDTNTPIGVVLVTHGAFGATLLAAGETILGKQDACVAVGVDVEKGVDETLGSIRKAIHSVDKGRGVICLTDLFGGSPTTMSLSLTKAENLEVVTGVNLPMLVAALQDRSGKLGDLVDAICAAGQQGIKVPSAMLRKKAKAKK